jgi:hypothetical protein
VEVEVVAVQAVETVFKLVALFLPMLTMGGMVARAVAVLGVLLEPQICLVFQIIPETPEAPEALA